mmetsp:Transcript_15977/g.46245  ORF Transcript_15977/g.46245 Transcript_15977/m.46245 type:complete len:323 (+) Transcript_15977:95-1063(+)
MGRKVALVTAGVGGIVFLLSVTGFFLPLHTVAILSLHKKLCRIRLNTVWVDIDASIPQLWCNEMPRSPPDEIGNRRREVRDGYGEARKWWCTNEWSEIRDLQSIADKACAPAVQWLWPSFCEGMSNAYVAGWFLLIVLVSNSVIAQGFVAYILHDYATRRPKKELRKLATALIGVGALVMFVVVLGYAFVVSVSFDDARNGTLQSFAVPRFLLSTSQGFGFDWGFVFLMAAICVQLAQLICCKWIKTAEEEEVELAKEKARANLMGYGTISDQEQPPSYSGGLGTSWQVPQSVSSPVIMTPPCGAGAVGSFTPPPAQADVNW